jgi:hypothetical protein
MRDLKRSIVASIFVTALVWPVLASANYSESADGDLSGNYLSPTPISLGSQWIHHRLRDYPRGGGWE